MAAVCPPPRLFTPTPPPKLSPLWSTTPRYSQQTPAGLQFSVFNLVLFLPSFVLYSIILVPANISMASNLSVIHTLAQINLVFLVVYQINSQFSALQTSSHFYNKKKVESKHDLCRSATPKQARLIFLGVRVSSRCPSAQTRLLTALPTSLS